MFNGERYNKIRDIVAQLNDQITGVTTRAANVPLAFAFSARFVRDYMQGYFTDTVIINMGCVSYYSDEIARSFIVKAAWDPDHRAVRNY